MRPRETGIDLLRFVSMAMIVTLHYIGWGGALKAVPPLSPNYFILSGLEVFCMAGVNCFYLISGFYLKPDDRIDFTHGKNRVLCIWGKAAVYSIGCYLFLCMIGFIPFSEKQLILKFFPIMTNSYWFITIFIILSLLKPFLAKVVCKISDKELFLLLCILFFFDSIQAVFGKDAIAEDGYGIFHAISMFLLGYAFQRYRKLQIGKKKGLFLYLAASMAAGITTAASLFIWKDFSGSFLDYNSPFIVASSVGLFSFFRGVKNCPVIFSKIAPYILAVYLINDHPDMRAVFWEKALHCSRYYESAYFILHLAGCVFGYLAVGILLDFAAAKLRFHVRRLMKSKSWHGGG